MGTLFQQVTQLLDEHGIEATFAPRSISARIFALAQQVERETIEACIRQLGGRYGAAATKDLHMMLVGKYRDTPQACRHDRWVKDEGNRSRCADCKATFGDIANGRD